MIIYLEYLEYYNYYMKNLYKVPLLTLSYTFGSIFISIYSAITLDSKVIDLVLGLSLMLYYPLLMIPTLATVIYFSLIFFHFINFILLLNIDKLIQNKIKVKSIFKYKWFGITFWFVVFYVLFTFPIGYYSDNCSGKLCGLIAIPYAMPSVVLFNKIFSGNLPPITYYFVVILNAILFFGLSYFVKVIWTRLRVLKFK